jgi:uncharacterized membrane protein
LLKNVFTIGFDPEFSDHAGLVDNSKNRTLIQTKLQELGCGEVQVRFIVAEAPPAWNRPPTQASSNAVGASSAAVPEVAPPRKPAAEPATPTKEDFKNDPLIKQALEIFKGTIVEIRA